MMRLMRVGAIVIIAAIAAVPGARADERVDVRWPTPPPSHELTLDDRLANHLSEYGTELGAQLGVLSHDMIALRVDFHGNPRARLRVGGGNVRYLTLRLDSHWYFADNKATVHSRLDLGIAGHMFRLELPTMEVIPDSYHGQQLVQVNVPLLQRRF